MGPPEADVARWQGGVDEFRDNTKRRLDKGDRRMDKLDDRQDEFDRELTKVTTKIGIAAAAGSLLGGAIVTLILTVGTKALGG